MTRPACARYFFAGGVQYSVSLLFAFSLSAFAILPVVAALADQPSPGDISLSQGRGFEEQGGEALYRGVCAACHQPDAKGAVGAAAYPALAANKNLASADYVEEVLRDGLRSMPPVGRMMSDEQAADVINYVRTHFGNNYEDAVSAPDVKAAKTQGKPSP
jgi:mono/diheme cytochrome c family protein